MKKGRPKGTKQARNESKYWLPPGVCLKPGQSLDYNKSTKLIFVDSTYGEFISYFKAIQDANNSLHPKAIHTRIIERNTKTSKSTRAKAQNTMLKKYGVKNALENKFFLEKSRQTFAETHGVYTSSPFALKEIREKANATLTRNHDVTNAAKLVEKHILPNGKNIKEFCRELNVNSSFAYQMAKIYPLYIVQDWIENHKLKISTLESATLKLLPELKRYEKCPENVKHFRPDFILNNIYIDVDGLEYHSDLHKEEKEYHLRKREAFESAGYSLLQIRQDEIILKPDIVKSIIKTKAGLTTSKFRASDLLFSKINKIEADLFLNRTHLMGASNGVTCFGLKDIHGKLLSVMTVRVSKRELEIVRFSSELDTIIHGGLSKFLKNIKDIYKDKYNKIIYFVDLRYGTGNGLKQLGFKLVSITLGWKWTDTFNTYNRLYCRANMDERRLSENEYAKEMKLFRIYDAGQAKFEL